MDKLSLGKKCISQLLVMSLLVTACMPSDVPSNKSSFNSNTPADNVPGIGSGSLPTTGGVGSGTTLPPKVEIRHLIEPNLSTDLNYSPGTGHAGGGSYVRKLTLPKNFQGRLYLAGINIGSLSNRHVRVRFRFGVNREQVIIPATVTQAPGITPQTGINVLVMDLRSEPFRSIRLPYDLYDYNDYLPNENPVQDNRHTGLYCRGLRVEDDPTFVGVGACDGLQSQAGQPDEECLYAYAKVLDQGLVQESGSVFVPLTPSLPQAKSVVGPGYFQDSLNQSLKKPLADTIPTATSNVIDAQNGIVFAEQADPPSSSDAVNIFFRDLYTVINGTPILTTSIWDPLLINGTRYYYRGPYRLVNSLDWQFQFTELDGPKKLFRSGSWVTYPMSSISPLPDDPMVFTSPPRNYYNRLYYNSYLFPLATKLDLPANVSHLSSSSIIGKRDPNILATSGKTLWMDGSNARVQSRNIDMEHIGSCNVTASIEIIAKDNNNVDYVIANAKDVKLQLVRPTQHRTDTGNEVLFTNFKTCSSNASCGGNECCFNNRCWDQSLVSQCYDSSSTQGNRNVGQSCTTDLECTSLCCNRTSGMCAPHNALLNPAVLCSKPSGDFCIAKEWCQKSPVVKCLVIRTGTDPLGNTTCRQQCYTTEEFGDCKNGVCVPPVQESIPPFDPSDPSACANAVPAPNF